MDKNIEYVYKRLINLSNKIDEPDYPQLPVIARTWLIAQEFIEQNSAAPNVLPISGSEISLIWDMHGFYLEICIEPCGIVSYQIDAMGGSRKGNKLFQEIPRKKLHTLINWKYETN